MRPAPSHYPYTGRFAPSPTGRLHFGSLVTALASYLDARAHRGRWLVRIEDLDPPREEPGAADSILRSLEAHHLFWDGRLVYQSQRLEAYQAALDQLADNIYPCRCTRQRLLHLKGRYDGHCRQYPPTGRDAVALRLRTDLLTLHQSNPIEQFADLFLGEQSLPLSRSGDFILRRKDGLFAYQLAVAVDDAWQGITHVVRGCDLLATTSRQRYVLALLRQPLPSYGHTPLVVGTNGDKLSKQTRATPVQNRRALENLLTALVFLGYAIPKSLAVGSCSELLHWATEGWRRDRVPHRPAPLPQLDGDSLRVAKRPSP